MDEVDLGPPPLEHRGEEALLLDPLRLALSGGEVVLGKAGGGFSFLD